MRCLYLHIDLYINNFHHMIIRTDTLVETVFWFILSLFKRRSLPEYNNGKYQK